MSQQLRRVEVVMGWTRWQSRLFGVLFAVALGLTLILDPGTFSTAQENALATKADLIEKIEERAVNHANIGAQIYLEDVYEEFKDNEFGLDRTEIRDIYEEKFLEERERLETDIQEQLPSSLWGWLFGGTMMILFLFKDALSERGSKWIDGVLGWLYRRIAGNPLFLNIALDKYQKALKERLTNLDTPFKIDPPLAMAEVYVPLKIKQVAEDDEPRAQPLSQGTELDIYTAMVRHKRLMVTGPPGSGKSVLLKHIAFTYGEGKLDLPGQPIPVRLELNSLRAKNLDEAQFVSKLVAVLDANGFPNADRFVAQGLESGQLLLLLDGLDEVPSEIRDAVVLVINGVLEKYGDCPAIVTCRTAVYEHEFDVVLDRNLLEVVEFTDYQIRNFLQAWKSRMPAEKSVEQLMQTLQDRPKIKTLARNPLLLTIITYLYTETTFVLPHSRAEFYEKATNMLLELRDQERNIPNRYSAVAKRQVLRRLALVAQDTLNPAHPDRRSIPHQVVRHEVGQVLPDLNLPGEETAGILEEIIDRSGLLLEIDGGERFQFAHLTLQEFFAAAALQSDQDLLERFERDSVAWREVVKLWCGLVGNSTALIRAIYGRDELLAFECLAEAQEVEQGLADKIFRRMKGQLGRAATEEEVARAFGSVAADGRPRGKIILGFLQNQLTENQSFEMRKAAAKVLSHTNLESGLNILIDHYVKTNDVVENELIRMGDMAIQSIEKLIEKKPDSAIDFLFLIRTPKAASSLAQLLWNQDKKIATRAAWRLAVLSANQSTEEEFEKIANIPDFQNQKFNWLWQPFSDKTSNMQKIMGRVAELLTMSNAKDSPGWKIQEREIIGLICYYADPRLIVPLCLLSTEPEEMLPVDKEYINTAFNRESPTLEGQLDMLLSDVNRNSLWGSLFSGLRPRTKLDVVKLLLDSSQEIQRADWTGILKPIKFDFSRSRMYSGILTIAFVASLGAIVQILSFVLRQLQNSYDPLGELITFFAFTSILSFIALYQGEGEELEPMVFKTLGVCGIFFFCKGIRNLLRKPSRWSGSESIYKALHSISMMMFFCGFLILILVICVVMSESIPTIEIILALAIAMIWAWTVVGTVVLEETVVVLASITGFISASLVISGVMAVMWVWSWAASFAFGLSIGIWNEAYENQREGQNKPILFWKKLFAFFAFPFYCWFPTTTIFSLLGLKNLLQTLNTPHPWPIAITIWLTLFTTCCILWIIGQRKDRAARNPLHGILDDYYPQYKMQSNK